MERVSGRDGEVSERAMTHTKRSTTEDLPTAASPGRLVSKSGHTRDKRKSFFDDVPRRTSLTCMDLSD